MQAQVLSHTKPHTEVFAHRQHGAGLKVVHAVCEAGGRRVYQKLVELFSLLCVPLFLKGPGILRDTVKSSAFGIGKPTL